MPAAPRTREEATSARQDAILRAALKLFNRKGFAATSMEDIRRASGASVGSIYHHFGGKEAVAAALYANALADYQAGMIELVRSRPPARKGVEEMVRRHLHWIATHQEDARYLLAMRSAEVLMASKKQVRALNRVFFNEVFGWLEEQAEAGRIRKVPRNLYFPLVMGPSQELAREWLDRRFDTPLEDAAPLLADAAWKAIREGGRR